ncbi:MAG: hypothetical protein ACK6D7_01335 [Acidobacteriota bacterium]
MSATDLPLLREAAEQQLHLLSAAAGLPPANQRRLQQVFSLLSGDALDRPAEPHYPGLSHINASGLPLQWSVAAGEPLPSVRFLTECGPVGAPGPERLANSFARLQQAARLIGAENAALQAEQLTRQHLLPNAWPAHWRSALWSAAGAVGNHIALKIYCNLTAGDPASRWRRAGQLLATLGRTTALESLCHCSRLASRDSWPAGIAIALSPSGIGGVKIYFRSGAVETTSWHSRWYLACGYPHAEEHARLLLEICAPPSRTPAPPGAIVVSLEFPPADQPPALKTELELNRPSPTEQTTAARVRHLLHRMAIPAGPYEDALAALAPPGHQPTIHRLIGLRTDPSGTRRANIYLEPPPPALPTARPRPHPRLASRPAAPRWPLERLLVGLPPLPRLVGRPRRRPPTAPRPPPAPHRRNQPLEPHRRLRTGAARPYPPRTRPALRPTTRCPGPHAKTRRLLGARCLAAPSPPQLPRTLDQSRLRALLSRSRWRLHHCHRPRIAHRTSIPPNRP